MGELIVREVGGGGGWLGRPDGKYFQILDLQRLVSLGLVGRGSLTLTLTLTLFLIND